MRFLSFRLIVVSVLGMACIAQLVVERNKLLAPLVSYAKTATFTAGSWNQLSDSQDRLLDKVEIETAAANVTRPPGKMHLEAVANVKIAPAVRHPHCALLFFGLPRLFKEVSLPSIRKNILDNNPECDIFAHSYNVQAMTNKRNGEVGVKLRVEDLSLLTPRLILDTDDDFWQARNATVMKYRKDYFPDDPHWNWLYPTSMDNMIKQWHSIDRVWKLMQNKELARGIPYKRVGLFRSDVFYHNAINVMEEAKAVVPLFAACPANDRMFYGDRQYAQVWATQRFDMVDSYVERLRQEKTKNPKVMAKLHSELFMEGAILRRIRDLGAPVTNRDICFFRVRGTGQVQATDCYCYCTSPWKMCDSAKAGTNWTAVLHETTGLPANCSLGARHCRVKVKA